MTTTELIKILQDNETGAISLKPREISLIINGRYMPNPQITLSSTGDGICGPEIDLDINGKWLEQEPKTGRWIKDSLWTKPYCSECGKSCIGVHGFDCIITDFCPNCGAKMESENKE